MRIWGHSVYWIRLGSQECIGAMAALIISASWISSVFKVRNDRGDRVWLTKDTMIKEEEIVWIIKYLIVESMDLIDLLIMRIGITLIRLISSPIQAVAQEEEDTAIDVPVIITTINI